MNNYESINSKQNWEPEELPFWQLDDFVDVLQSKQVSTQEQVFNKSGRVRSSHQFNPSINSE